MSLNRIKRRIASVFDLFGINALGFALQRGLMFPFIRVVNYHDVPREHAANFESQLRYYSSRFADVNEQKLRGFLNGEPWPAEKPGIILSFDDGLSSHSEVVAPALEKYGFTGWFFVPADRVMASPGSSKEDGTASPDPIISLARRHVIGSHTTTHCRLISGLAEEKLRYEILESKLMLGAALEHEVNIFCWVGGEEVTYSRAAANIIKTGYDLSFMTNNAPIRPNTNPLQLQRTNIEAENPLSLVRFQISGILDLLYLPKRRRVNKLTR